jgi:TonB family protein
MNRLNQKCFVASAGVHILLMVILLIGPAFLTSKSKSDSSPPLDIIPGKLIDDIFKGGGNPQGTPPPPAPETTPPAPRVVQPAPQPEPVKPPEPVKTREPEPPKETIKDVKPPKPSPDALEPAPEPKRKKPEVSTTPIVRKQDKDTSKTAKTNSTTASTDNEERRYAENRQTASTDNEERRYAENRQRALNALNSAARTIGKTVAPGTTIEPNPGFGGGGEAYAPYDEAVRSIYWHAWIPPDDTASDQAIAKATVVIARDGTVLSAHIIKPSGDASVDRSVQQALEHVTFIAPFPEGAKDKERTYTIKFDLKARRLTG